MSIDTLFSRTVCINLDRRPDRWARMRSRFARHGLETVERVSAYDGSLGDVPPTWSGMGGAYGCLRSHVAAVAAAVADGAESLLVFEDDVEFAPDFVPRFLRAYAELPHDWSFLYLGGSHRRPPEPVGEVLGRATYTLSTFAFALRRAAFPLFLGLDPSTPEAIDTRLARLQAGRVFHCVCPNLAWVDCDFSDVQGSVSNHWYIRESLVIGDECDPDMAGRVGLVLPLGAPGWRDVEPGTVALLEDHFREAIPGLLVVTDHRGDLPPEPLPCARRASAGFGPAIDHVLIAGSPVLFSRSHLLGALQMCRAYPVVSPFSEVVPLTRPDIHLVLSGRRKSLDLTTYAREPRGGLELGWGFFRRDALDGECSAVAPPALYEVPSFGLDLRSRGPRGAVASA